MKKFLILALTLILTFSACAALAEKIEPMMSVNMDDITDCDLSIGFNTQDVTETTIPANVYDVLLYDAVAVTNLAVGDVVSYLGSDITVESIDVDYSTEINGGIHEGGITLLPNEGGTYIAIDEDNPIFALVGVANFNLADEVTYRHWQENPDGSISPDFAETTVPAAHLKDLLTQEADEFYPASTVITVQDGKVVSFTVNYTP